MGLLTTLADGRATLRVLIEPVIPKVEHDWRNITDTAPNDVHIIPPDQDQYNIQVPDGLIHTTPTPPAEGFTGWVNSTADSFIDWQTKTLFAPLGEAIKHGMHDLVVAGIHTIPIIFTVFGLFCFILTMAMGNGRPYMWGMTCWAISVAGRMVSHAFDT